MRETLGHFLAGSWEDSKAIVTQFFSVTSPSATTINFSEDNSPLFSSAFVIKSREDLVYDSLVIVETSAFSLHVSVLVFWQGCTQSPWCAEAATRLLDISIVGWPLSASKAKAPARIRKWLVCCEIRRHGRCHRFWKISSVRLKISWAVFVKSDRMQHVCKMNTKNPCHFWEVTEAYLEK